MFLKIAAGVLIGGVIGAVLGYYGKCSSGGCPLTAVCEMFLKIAAGVLIGGVIGAVLGYYGKCSSGGCPLTANPFRGAVYGALMGAVLTSVFYSSSADDIRDKSSKQFQTQTNEKKQMVIHIENASDFQTKVLGTDMVSLVDFYSDRCPPCRMLAPTIISLA